MEHDWSLTNEELAQLEESLQRTIDALENAQNACFNRRELMLAASLAVAATHFVEVRVICQALAARHSDRLTGDVTRTDG
jgi:hypothetical protein